MIGSCELNSLRPRLLRAAAVVYHCCLTLVPTAIRDTLTYIKPAIITFVGYCYRPCPVRNLFRVVQFRRGRSKPGGQTGSSATRERFTTSVVDHSALHAEFALMSSGGGSNQTGRLEDRRAVGCDKISAWSGYLSFPFTLANSLIVASCRRRCGGGMLLSTGNHGSGVGRNVPVMVRMDVLSCTSTSLV